MAEKEYKRLTRSSARGFIGITRASLWLGNDHLLCVDTTGYSESYKRFYFRDIQAIIVRVTTTRSAWNYILGAAVFFFFILGLVGNRAVMVIFICLMGLSALALIINQLRGPTCTCQIRTAVQTEFLPVPRIRVAQRILDRVRPLIASAQGQLTPEEVAARMAEPPPAEPAPVTPASAPVAAASETINAAPASSLSSPNEERAGVRSLGVQGEIFSSQSAEDPNAPPPATS